MGGRGSRTSRPVGRSKFRGRRGCRTDGRITRERCIASRWAGSRCRPARGHLEPRPIARPGGRIRPGPASAPGSARHLRDRGRRVRIGDRPLPSRHGGHGNPPRIGSRPKSERRSDARMRPGPAGGPMHEEALLRDLRARAPGDRRTGAGRAHHPSGPLGRRPRAHLRAERSRPLGWRGSRSTRRSTPASRSNSLPMSTTPVLEGSSSPTWTSRRPRSKPGRPEPCSELLREECLMFPESGEGPCA